MYVRYCSNLKIPKTAAGLPKSPPSSFMERDRERESLREERAGINGAFFDSNNNGEGWTTVRKRKGEKNITTLYISGLPNGCTSGALRKPFNHMKTVKDVYVPHKKDRRGHTFGFLRFDKVMWPEKLVNEVSGILIDGCKIVANLTKYEKENKYQHGWQYPNISGQNPNPSSQNPNSRNPKATLGRPVLNPTFHAFRGVSNGVSYREALAGKSKNEHHMKTLILEDKIEYLGVSPIPSKFNVQYLGG